MIDLSHLADGRNAPTVQCADEDCDYEELSISVCETGQDDSAGIQTKAAESLYPDCDPHNCLLAIAAPSLSARSFAQTMLSATFGSLRTAVPKPQLTPAMSRWTPMICA